MKIAVIVSSTRLSWSTRRLIAVLRSRGHHVLLINASDVALVADKGFEARIGPHRLDPDAVIVRSLGMNTSLEQFLSRLTVLAFLEEMGIPVINPWLPTLIARTKMLTTLFLAKAGIPVPPTLLTESLGVTLHYVREWGSVVFKPLTGSLGLGAFKADDIDTAYHVASMFLSFSRPVYMQAFIPKSGNSDKRVFVVGDSVVAAARRVAPPGEWKTNVARGGKVEPTTLDEEEERIAVKAVKALGLYYAGVDIARGTDDKLVVFEVNAMPNWRGLYRATGVDPAEHIARLLEGLAKRGGEE
ncbi:alpha-L-glutamate ligase, RimK family [Pyrolobus fumarii 1A]|uniref:Alpha-L-glutamate ligase, RimK family n=1 Tax=Pyrolobus fumarii (strain DSM 11204 / 1A) TaxID=694429 RepID=G0ECI6_PYRF1|nr:RimK family alpha-L-glutamate ligase [Pyrolobus fumarii]AEM39556.1 alpha-L-glutamate ligase, RimK family [Pyrolobus fumarii 1A]